MPRSEGATLVQVFSVEDLMSKLDSLLEAHERMVCRQVDAGACQTTYDYKRKHTAEEQFYDLRDEFETELKKAVGICQGPGAASRS
jgi:hypothetical protein